VRAFWNKNGKTGLIDPSPEITNKSPSAGQMAPPVRLTLEELCCRFSPESLSFDTTANLPVKHLSVGQERAVKAISFGLKIKSRGFNVFASGLAGTGKDSAILQELNSIARSEPVPEDICYVYNHKNPHSPKLLYFPAGLGRKFKCEIKELLRKTAELFQKYYQSDYSQLLVLLDGLFGEMAQRFSTIKGLSDYLIGLKEDLFKNIGKHKPDDSSNKFSFLVAPEKYEVNLLVDNSETTGAPVVVERNPSYSNLFGYIQYRVENSFVVADHLCLQAGSVHRARGGYLILEVEEILGDLHAWNALKKLLRHGHTNIEYSPERTSMFPGVFLKPEPISIDLKVILTGDPVFYQTLYNNDDEFVRIFKVKADFAEQLSKTEENIDGLVSFIARICNEENLRHCDRTAVARIIDYSSRLAEHKHRLSAQFEKIADLLREADFHAGQNECSFITGEHIVLACEALKYRCSTMEEKIYGLIEDSTLYLDTTGWETGQVNGVSIVNNGDYVFGVPSRITARTFIGAGNIINIEREAEMSGKIHAKGVLILSGYLGQTYAQDKPLALSASICFEQHYEEIDGDSASSAELYCLMSSLSGLPLRQDIAVTGSVDQRGMIQPVGGINTKIEGFFKACQLKGLSGTQGMIIPKDNVKNLMLSDEILEAVKKNMFHIYAVSTIEQGLQILTGKDPGKISSDGSFQPDTIHFLVNQKLRDYASVVDSYEKEKDQYL
jgi:lon-related putative ATP-dependent protease